jgi:hypothetical protein
MSREKAEKQEKSLAKAATGTTPAAAKRDGGAAVLKVAAGATKKPAAPKPKRGRPPNVVMTNNRTEVFLRESVGKTITVEQGGEQWQARLRWSDRDYYGLEASDGTATIIARREDVSLVWVEHNAEPVFDPEDDPERDYIA